MIIIFFYISELIISEIKKDNLAPAGEIIFVSDSRKAKKKQTSPLVEVIIFIFPYKIIRIKPLIRVAGISARKYNEHNLKNQCYTFWKCVNSQIMMLKFQSRTQRFFFSIMSLKFFLQIKRLCFFSKSECMKIVVTRCIMCS